MLKFIHKWISEEYNRGIMEQKPNIDWIKNVGAVGFNALRHLFNPEPFVLSNHARAVVLPDPMAEDLFTHHEYQPPLGGYYEGDIDSLPKAGL